MATDSSRSVDDMATLVASQTSTLLYIVDGALSFLAVVLAGLLVLMLRRHRGNRPAGDETVRSPAELDRAPLRRQDQLGASLDLDDVFEGALELLLEVPAISAAAIMLRPDPRDGASHAPLVATLGIEPVELAGLPLDWGSERPLPSRAMITYDYGEGSSAGTIGGGVLIPLPGEGSTPGTIAALWRGQTKPTAEQLAVVDEIAEGVAIPVENARRHRAALSSAEIDSLTGLYNRRYFHEMLVREIARTQRYGRRLTVAILDVDDFKVMNEQLGHLACDAILAAVASSVRGAIRTSDVACRVGGDEFGVILTEAAAADAEHFFQRLRFGLSTDAGGQRVTLSAGAAELRPDDDSGKVFERADAALFQAKRSGRDQLALAANLAGPSDLRSAGESA